MSKKKEPEFVQGQEYKPAAEVQEHYVTPETEAARIASETGDAPEV